MEISKLSLNVILHVTILYTILAFLFMLYISKITTDGINKEISHIITSNLEKMLYTPDGEPIKTSLNISNLNNTIIDNISSILTVPLQNIINQNILNDPTIKTLVSNNDELKNKLNNIANTTIQESIKSNININNSEITLQITDILKKIILIFLVNQNLIEQI